VTDGAGRRPVERGWPPYCASLCVEVWSDDTVRVLYQFEPMASGDSAAAGGEAREPLAAFLRRVDALSVSHDAHEVLCKSTPRPGGAVFTFRD
jgi:hypothetical protein